MENYAQSLKVFHEEKKTEEFNESFDHEFVPIDGEVELDILANRFITVKLMLKIFHLIFIYERKQII